MRGRGKAELPHKDNTHWRTGTDGMTWSIKYAAVSDIRLAPHEGQNPRRLQENANN
jgi:hypothetical protein